MGYKLNKLKCLRYEAEELTRYIESHLKKGYIPCIRYCSADEMGKFENYKNLFTALAKQALLAPTDELRAQATERLRLARAEMSKDLGVDGEVYKTAEQNNNTLVPGENYIFMFRIDPHSIKNDVTRALALIKPERQYTEQLNNNSYPDYESCVFFIKQRKTEKGYVDPFPTHQGRYWSNGQSYYVDEMHILAKDYDPMSFQEDSITKDVLMAAEYYSRSRNKSMEIQDLASEEPELFERMIKVLRELGEKINYSSKTSQPPPSLKELAEYFPDITKGYIRSMMEIKQNGIYSSSSPEERKELETFYERMGENYNKCFHIILSGKAPDDMKRPSLDEDKSYHSTIGTEGKDYLEDYVQGDDEE